jgi:hypothetical protein
VVELSIASAELVLSICLFCIWHGSRREIGIFEAFAEMRVCRVLVGIGGGMCKVGIYLLLIE